MNQPNPKVHQLLGTRSLSPPTSSVLLHHMPCEIITKLPNCQDNGFFTLIFATISLNFLLTLFFHHSPPSKPLELSLFTWHDTWTLYHRNGRAVCSLASSIIREVDRRTPLVILPAMPSVAAGQPVVDRLPTTWGLP